MPSLVRTISYATLGLLAMAFLPSCKDIFEEDITGFGVVLLTPPDGYSSVSNISYFTWEAVPRANNYRIQIVSPSFSEPVQFYFDSLVATSSFQASLAPGNYQWRVRGENENSTTGYYTRSLTVTEASTLDGLTPILNSPLNAFITQNDTITFSWMSLNGADDHRFELRTGDQTGPLVTAQIVVENSITLNGFSEGAYTWGVQGQNSTSTSAFSYRTFTIDRTAPTVPVLQAPTDLATLPNAPFDFQWQSGIDASSSTTDSLVVFGTATQPIRVLLVAGNTYSDSLGLGSYTWYVSTTDAVGNTSTSLTNSFTIQ